MVDVYDLLDDAEINHTLTVSQDWETTDVEAPAAQYWTESYNNVKGADATITVQSGYEDILEQADGSEQRLVLEPPEQEEKVDPARFTMHEQDDAVVLYDNHEQSLHVGADARNTLAMLRHEAKDPVAFDNTVYCIERAFNRADPKTVFSYTSGGIQALRHGRLESFGVYTPATTVLCERARSGVHADFMMASIEPKADYDWGIGDVEIQPLNVSTSSYPARNSGTTTELYFLYSEVLEPHFSEEVAQDAITALQQKYVPDRPLEDVTERETVTLRD